DALRAVAARALGQLGVARAWVVRGEDALDEVSPCARTRVSELLASGEVKERTIAPEDFGVARVERAAIAGADAEATARALTAILTGEAHAAREAVILNAAAALAVASGDALRDCAARARAAIDRGAARATLEAWRAAARKACAR